MRNRFSTDVKESLSLSAEEAIRMGSPAISAGHILLGLISQGHNRGVEILTHLGLSMAELIDAVQSTLPAGRDDRSSWRVPLDRGAERAVRRSVAMARKAGSRMVDAGHLLYSLFDDRENELYLVFGRLGVERLPDGPNGQ